MEGGEVLGGGDVGAGVGVVDEEEFDGGFGGVIGDGAKAGEGVGDLAVGADDDGDVRIADGLESDGGGFRGRQGDRG